MDEQSFLAAIENSMQESARQQLAMGRQPASATREEALRQVQMLQAAKEAWELENSDKLWLTTQLT